MLLGLIIFTARVVDVSLGTIRTIVIVQGKTTSEQACDVSKVLRPFSTPVTGWRSPFGGK